MPIYFYHISFMGSSKPSPPIRAQATNSYLPRDSDYKPREHHYILTPAIETKMDEDDQKVAIMRKAFQMFDTSKSGFIDTLKISTILNTMGQLFDDSELNELIEEVDPDETGKVNFDGFCEIAAHFLEEDDAEAMQEELKEAFRLYDREGNGYITTATLREILAALDDKLGPEDLDGIIAEIDTDGSGTVDFDEFMEMMTGE
ncbi:PREDICTED: troponin C [Diuraphis noxia]|uniref:troponin C n=1 Tax=Diuraphis noxia TaxID=143948 RepID=UPI0007637598|nr:PREDICTED: troponin C [Diuraphis noxia]